MTSRRIVQPSGTTCGPTALVVARAHVTGDEPRDVAAAITALHRRLSRVRDGRGRLQWPWPRALGTSPWAAARELGVLTGARYRVRWVRRRPALEASGSLPALLFVGSRWLPRHVVLVTDAAAGWRVYDPATGRMVRRSATDASRHRLRLGGWDIPWFVISTSQAVGDAGDRPLG